MAKLRSLTAACLFALTGCEQRLICLCDWGDAGTFDAGSFEPADAAVYAGPRLQCDGIVLERYEADGATFVVSDVCENEAACQQSVEADSDSCVAP